MGKHCLIGKSRLFRHRGSVVGCYHLADNFNPLSGLRLATGIGLVDKA